VSPGFSRAVVARCRQLGLPVFPGVATATEVQAALDEQLPAVKFFPAESLGGAATIAALAGPFGALRFIPTGGIGSSQLAGYLSHRSVLAVGGSWMVAPALIRERDWAQITALTAAAVTLADTIRPRRDPGALNHA
jgi:2-dehydro-3-deoxyphosphogluconate aldolase/(4S)-4-hydroxy-2-oxoglutarate aldolase